MVDAVVEEWTTGVASSLRPDCARRRESLASSTSFSKNNHNKSGYDTSYDARFEHHYLAHARSMESCDINLNCSIFN
jgi:hypothetical protein